MASNRPTLERGWPLVAAVVLAVAVAAAHGAGIQAPFHYDDKVEIVLNPALHGYGHWLEIWTYNPFRFLLLCTFAVQVNSSGDQTWPFHALNLLIHLVNAGLVATLAGRVLSRVGPACFREGWPHRLASLSTGLLFAVHPLLVEGVTYISGRSSSLATAIYLASFLVLDGLLRREERDPALAARWQVLVRRLGLLAALAVGAGLLGSAASVVMLQRGVVDPVRAWPVGVAAIAVGLVPVGLLAWWSLRRPLPAGPRTWPLVARWCLLGLLFGVGMMTKEIAVTIPAGLWLWELCMSHRGRLRPALARLGGFYLPFLVGPTAVLIYRTILYGSLAPPDAIVRPPLINLWTQAEVIWRYLGLFVWPVGQSVFHDHPASAGLLTWPTLAAVAVAILALAGGVLSLRRSPGLAFVVLWTAVALAPSSSLLPLKETMAEHRSYLPAAAWCLSPVLLVGLVPGLRERGLAAALVVALLAIPLGVRTVQYTRMWNEEETLWQRVVELSPGSPDAWYMLGDIARTQGRPNDAMRRYEHCLDLEPDHYDATINLGLVEGERGNLEGAMRRFEQAGEICAGRQRCCPEVYVNVANVHAIRRRHVEAAQTLESALICDPDSCQAHLALGRLHDGPLSDAELALTHYEAAARACPPPLDPWLARRIEELRW